MTERSRDERLSFETAREGEIRRLAVFGLQNVARRSKRTGRAGEFQMLHMPQWVSVIALTPDLELRGEEALDG